MINFEIILNVFIGVFVYNIFLKSLGKTLIDSFMRTKSINKEVEKGMKTFKERLEEKQSQTNN